MKTIKLTQGKIAIVDDADFDMVNQYKWHFHNDNKNGYAARCVRLCKNKQRKQFMHRLIMGLPMSDKREIDHINHNKLDNRRKNLRVCTHSQNQFNREINSTNRCGYKGVYWDNGSNKYRSEIRVNNKRIHLGLFSNKVDAAKAYIRAARKYHGDFAPKNI